VAACGSTAPEDRPPEIEIRGQVTVGDRPAATGEALVYLLDPRGEPAMSVLTRADGEYRIRLEEADPVCRSALIAVSPASRLPAESRLRAVPDDGSDCRGIIDVPELQLPALPIELHDLRLTGGVTRGGAPAGAAIRLSWRSRPSGVGRRGSPRP
jgi:hypothetical protein